MAEKLQVLLRLLWLCFFSVFTVVVGNTVLLAVPQARETLFALADGAGDDTWRFVCFALAYLYWAFTAWFVARLMLSRRFDPDPVGADRLPRFADACARIIPRTLGLLAGVPLALGMLAVSVVYAVILGALSIGFLLVVWRRRHWFLPATMPPGQDSPYYRHVDALSTPARQFLALLFAVSWVVFFAVWSVPVQASRAIGSPALLLVALGAWTLVGSMLLSYWPRTRRWPNLMAVPLLLLLASASDNHPVAGHRPDAPATDWRAARPGLEAHFDGWMAEHRRHEPVILVAVAGGASRAAYWSGLTLARLEDEARAGGRRFGSNVFLLSAVSGGSLGAAAFVSALAAWPDARMRLSEPLDRLLGQDLLAPVVGMLLYPDLVQRFLPLLDTLRVADRSVALEQAWSLDWQAVLARHPSATAQAGRWWTSPLVQPYLDRPGRRLPSLVLNTVRLEDGRRLLQSNLAFDLPEAQDLLAPGFDTHHLSLAGAVHNSARFPYISPAGRVRLPATPGQSAAPVWGHLGDGGYHEASGARSLIDIIARLQASGRIRNGTAGLQACGVDGGEAHCDSPVVLLLLDNQPRPWGPDWQRDFDGRMRAVDGLQRAGSWPVHELSAPVQGLLAAWSSNTVRAERQLALLAGPGGERYVELRFPRYALKRQPSMNWHLDAGSRELLRTASAPLAAGAVPTNLADRALLVNLQQLRGWIARTAP